MTSKESRRAGDTAQAADSKIAGSDGGSPSTTGVATQSVASDFLKRVFGQVTELPIFICSFPNERYDETEPGERHFTTRMSSHITDFVAKWDRPKRGLFFCTGIVKPSAMRNKENIAQTICLHADIDFKDLDETPADVLKKLMLLRSQPSIVVASGGGFHIYYLFNEALDTQSNLDRIELALRQLADLVGGDLQCCEVSRVMRLPGTHNTKNGAWTPVEVISDTGQLYELDDLEEWLSEQSPILLRKSREHAKTAGETDYFTQHGKANGFKPRIDVKARLDAMMYMASGDAGVHATQIAVMASLLSSGVPLDETITMIMAATRAAAVGYGEHWNWTREERKLRRDGTKWLKDHPPKNAVTVSTAKQSGATQLVPLHHIIGGAVIGKLRHDGEDIIAVSKGVWHYSDGLWTLRTDTQWLDALIEIVCHGLNHKSNNKLIVEVRKWIIRQPDIYRLKDVSWDAHGKIPTRSGLIDPVTLDLTPAKSTDFCSWRIECDYDPAATCPWWETMIAELFSDRDKEDADAHVGVVQEVLGAALIDVKPRELSKALIFFGGSNCGKTVTIEVMAGLFGAAQITTALDKLEGTHNTMPFIKRLPWVLHEAFTQGKWHFSSTVKTIITHEPIEINIKNGPLLSAVVRGPIFWGTNFPPQFKEATKAIVNRLIVIDCRRHFDPDAELIGAAAEAKRRGFDKPSSLILQTELPGLLNWAFKGLKRAAKRGRFATTAQIKEAADEIHRDGNLVAGFIDECVQYQFTRMVSAPDFCAAFTVWFVENRGEDRGTPSNESIGRALAAMSDPRIAIDRKQLRDKLCRYYAGFVLNNAGFQFWRRAVMSERFAGKTTNTTPADCHWHDVNRLIPQAWSEKPIIKAMQKAAREARGEAERVELDDPFPPENGHQT